MQNGLEENEPHLLPYYKAIIKNQAEKISDLLKQNEESAAALFLQQEKYEKEVEEQKKIIEAMAPFQHICLSLLGSDPAAVFQRIEVLQGHYKAMYTPGHRLITLLGRVIGKGVLGRTLRKIANIVFVFKPRKGIPSA